MKIVDTLSQFRKRASSLVISAFSLAFILGTSNAFSNVFDLGDSLHQLDRGERLVVVNLHGFDQDKVFLHFLECDFTNENFTELQVVFPDNDGNVQDLELNVGTLRKLISKGNITSGTRIINGSYILHYHKEDGFWNRGIFGKGIQFADYLAERALAKNEPELSDKIRGTGKSAPQKFTSGDERKVRVDYAFTGSLITEKTIFRKGEIVGKFQTLFFDQDLLPKLRDKELRMVNDAFPGAEKMYAEKNVWLFKPRPFGFQLDPVIDGNGVKIKMVLPKSKADEGGLKANETIKSVNGMVADSLQSILQSSEEGDLEMILEVENVDGVVRQVVLVRDAPPESIRSFFEE